MKIFLHISPSDPVRTERMRDLWGIFQAYPEATLSAAHKIVAADILHFFVLDDFDPFKIMGVELVGVSTHEQCRLTSVQLRTIASRRRD